MYSRTLRAAQITLATLVLATAHALPVVAQDADKITYEDDLSELSGTLEVGSGLSCGPLWNELSYDFKDAFRQQIEATVREQGRFAPVGRTYDFGVYEFDIDARVSSKGLLVKKYVAETDVELALRVTVRDGSEIVFQDLVSGSGSNEKEGKRGLLGFKSPCERLVRESSEELMGDIYRDMEPRIVAALSVAASGTAE